MAKWLQSSPLGLLGLFRLKVLGRNPDGFGEDVIPVVEVSDFYGAPLLEAVGVSTAVAAAGSATTIPVPQGEVWRVHGVGARLDMTAAITATDGIGISIAVDTANAARCQLAQNNDRAMVLATGLVLFEASAHFDRPLVLRGGTNLVAVNDRVLSAGCQLRIQALIERVDTP